MRCLLLQTQPPVGEQGEEIGRADVAVEVRRTAGVSALAARDVDRLVRPMRTTQDGCVVIVDQVFPVTYMGYQCPVAHDQHHRRATWSSVSPPPDRPS